MTTFHNAKTRKALKELPLFRKLSNKEQLEYMRVIKNAATLNEHEKAVVLFVLKEEHLKCFANRKR